MDNTTMISSAFEYLPQQPFHTGQVFANQTLEWLPTDSEENFHKLMQDPQHQRYFAEKGWDQPRAITYQINSHGFRCDEFNKDPCIVALGCSYTVGIGLPVQDIWPSVVGKHLALPVVNLAWGGYSADSCFRLAEFWLPRLNPVQVVMLAPTVDRVEVVQSNQQAMTWMATNVPDSAKDHFLTDWMLNSENGRLNRLKNTLALAAFCQELQVPFYSYDVESFMHNSREQLEYARDYMHAGPLGHRILAERIINDIAAIK
jgi:hypothetical protein